MNSVEPAFDADRERGTDKLVRDTLARLAPHGCAVEPRGTDFVVSEVPSACERDHLGARRLLACGAALSITRTVLRMFGHDLEVVFPDDPGRPDEVAVLRQVGTRPPTRIEWDRYVALERMRRTEPDHLTPAGRAVLDALAAPCDWPGVAVSVVDDVTLVVTSGVTRRDQVLAGAAAHTVRLDAAVAGLDTAFVALTAPDPPRLTAELRALARPHALVRVGYEIPVNGGKRR
ncbi:hypothetical protein [Amycolatopsis sp. CA-230715]|uniref:hypothetical protein n=1 Tax=Amycolatopsis sp. CA-230715 TaxID=2745196 RepID=UPI001C032801|nr:hypothetical protein [Amycolatopsis sp. CA-230715]QWF78012.1 hypothetical protein HUW46_01405 [Amycolatopsis sp. CA-230715]